MQHRFFLIMVCLMCTVWAVCAAAAASSREITDLVGDLPGFPSAARPFKTYSGILRVNASASPVAGYDGWSIYYQLEMSQSDPDSDPLVAWHSGGPGTSSLYGLYGEVGYFQLSGAGPYANQYAWNRLSNMVYLESPAGSYLPGGLGSSACYVGGEQQASCSWNDTTQAEAYVLTLRQFIKEFPQFNSRALYLVGESYAGQYLPNIAHHILKSAPDLASQLRGLAIGNGCWGGDADHVACNGPNQNRDLVRMIHGKGLMSDDLNTEIQNACQFPDLPVTALPGPVPSGACGLALNKMDDEVGPYNIFNLYDNCRDVPKQQGHQPIQQDHKYLRQSSQMPAGYSWSCGQFDAIPEYLGRPDVREALHLPTPPAGSQFVYNQSGPASITLYPQLIKALQVLIFNGDTDTVVPYLGSAAWTASMESAGVVKTKAPWHPWTVANTTTPAGAATTYSVVGADHEFAFVTVRLAGHQVPYFNPSRGFEVFRRFIMGEEW